MEVPVINRISDFDVGVNDGSFISQAFSVSGVRNLHQAYSFWKWGTLLFIAFFASFTTLITRIKILVHRLRNVNVSLPSTTLLFDYDSDSDWSFSSDTSDEDNEDVDDEDEDDDSVNGELRVNDDANKDINRNIPWMRRCSGSFGDLLDVGSSGVVKLWDHLNINGERDHCSNAVASFFDKCGASSLLSPAVLFAVEKKRSDAVKVGAWDTRASFQKPALVAEWRQPGGWLPGKIIRVEAGDVDKIYVGDDISGEIIMGDMRMFNGGLLTNVDTLVNGSVGEIYW